MTPDETRSVLLVLHTAHDRAIPDGLTDIWSNTLGDLDYDLVREAALDLIRTSPYLPKVSEVRERALAIRRQRGRAHHEVLALPSRFESDADRAERIRRGVAACRAAVAPTRALTTIERSTP